MKIQKEIEQLANEWVNGIDESYQGLLKAVYIKGYTQCQEDMADKKYTDEDMINIVNKSRETGLTAEYLILQKKQTILI